MITDLTPFITPEGGGSSTVMGGINYNQIQTSISTVLRY